MTNNTKQSEETYIRWSVNMNSAIEVGQLQPEPILTIHHDGRVTTSPRLKTDEISALVLDQIKTAWLKDAQATKIREMQDRIMLLEEAVVWQPIETAPTDMTWVIGYDAKDGEVGTIIFDLTGDVDDEDVHYEWTDGMRTWNPTHWMPLPEPPEAKEAKP